eukprot:jgi/Tetstr1/438576/TSEL_027127.t1
MGVDHILANLSSRSPPFMTELRQLCFVPDICIRARYIKTTANICVDRLSRKIDYHDLAFNLRHFNHLDNILGLHTIDRFATKENTRAPRYNSRWRDPYSEATDMLRLPDGAWRREHNY